MNPYRDAASLSVSRARDTARFPMRKAVCYAIALATLGPIFLHVQARELANPNDSVAHFAQIGWIPWLAPLGIIA